MSKEAEPRIMRKLFSRTFAVLSWLSAGLVLAGCGGGLSPQASATTDSAVPAPAVPAAPSGVTATGGTKQVTLSWPAVSGATSYNVYYATASGFAMSSAVKITGAASPVIQSGLADGSAYYYLVTAVNGAGESAASVQVAATTLAAAPALTPPAAPGSMTATGGANLASLSWTTVAGATSYNVYYSDTAGVTTSTGTKVSATTSPYLKVGLVAGTTYYFIVTAVNGAGESAATPQVSTATTPFDALAFYKSVCLGCHGALGPVTAPQISAAISGAGGMSDFRSTGATPLTAAQVGALAAVSY